METATTTTTQQRVYATSEAQRRAAAKWKSANREYYNAHKRDAFKIKYYSDQEYRLKKIEQNLAWYYTTKEKKQAAAAGIAAAAAAAAIEN
jgi:hypothetical protein